MVETIIHDGHYDSQWQAIKLQLQLQQALFNNISNVIQQQHNVILLLFYICIKKVANDVSSTFIKLLCCCMWTQTTFIQSSPDYPIIFIQLYFAAVLNIVYKVAGRGSGARSGVYVLILFFCGLNSSILVYITTLIKLFTCTVIWTRTHDDWIDNLSFLPTALRQHLELNRKYLHALLHELLQRDRWIEALQLL